MNTIIKHAEQTAGLTVSGDMARRINAAHQAALSKPDDLATRLQALRDKAVTTQGEEVWKPQPGDVLAGVLIGVDTEVIHPQYGRQTQAILEDETGQRWRVWLNKFLIEALRRQGADLGDLACLTFHGKEMGKNGPFNRYSCIVDRATDRSSVL